MKMHESENNYLDSFHASHVSHVHFVIQSV